MSKSIKRKAENFYKKELKKAEKLVGNTTTYSNDLYIVCKNLFGKRFKGVFAFDKTPRRLKKGSMMIVNLDNSNEPGSHWIALCNDKRVLIYDSFGRKKKEITPKHLVRSAKVTEKDKEQSEKETNCGARCIAFLSVFDKLGYNHAIFI